MQAERACAVGAELGEGPLWVDRDAAVWFVDIKGRQIHRFRPATRELKSWEAPDQVGFIVPVRGGGYVVGLKSGLNRFDAESGTFDSLHLVDPHLPNNRLNDCCVGPEGTLWFGTMDDHETNPSGALYSYGDAGLIAHDGGYVISNGPAFSPDGRTFYHTNTSERAVYAFDRDSANKISNKRVFVRIEAGTGYPDGSTVDAEGCVWVALFGGWSVRRYSPKGELLSSERLPCANVTKIAFGGPDRKTVYVTTAWKSLSQTERSAQPRAGDLFTFQSDVPGQKPVELRLSR
jgi:sugar lactone lactonase YvrE